MQIDDDYEGTDFSAADDAWNSGASNNARVEESKPPRYLDLKNSRIQNVGQKILDSSLSSAKQNSHSIDSLWRIFIEHIEAYAFAEEVARQIEQFKEDLQDAIKDDCYPELEKNAFDQVKKEVRERVEKQLIDEFRSQLTPVVRSAIHKQLEKEFEFSLRPTIADKLKRDLEPEVREQLRKDLLNDPVFDQQVRSELKKRILGI
jgi:hypothetical protein